MKKILLIFALLFITILSYSQVETTFGNVKVDTIKAADDERITIGLAGDTTNVNGILYNNGVVIGSGASYSGQLIDSSYIDYYSGATDSIKMSNAFASVDHVKFSREYTITSNGFTFSEGKTLEFLPGSKLTASSGTITGNNTSIINHDDHEIFDDRLTFAGTWRYDYVTPLWFGADSTGVRDCEDAFDDAASLMTDGSKFFLNAGTYSIEGWVNFDMYDRMKFDFNNSKIVGSGNGQIIFIGGVSFVDNDYTTEFISGLDSSVFITNVIDAHGYEVAKGNNYIKITDSADWKAYSGFNDGVCKINIGINDNSGLDSRYWKAVTFLFAGFGTEGGTQVIYSQKPFNRNVELSDALSIRNYTATKADYIQIIPLFNDIKIENANFLNTKLSVSNVINLYSENSHMYLYDSLAESASGLQEGYYIEDYENITITGHKAENFQRASLGYGINFQHGNDLLFTEFSFDNCRHGFTAGGYDQTSRGIEICNGKISNTNLDIHGNAFEVTIHDIIGWEIGEIASCRANGITVYDCQVYGNTETAILLNNSDAWEDDPVIISRVNVDKAIYGLLVAYNLETESITIKDCEITNPIGVTTGQHVLARLENVNTNDFIVDGINFNGEIDQEGTSQIIRFDTCTINKVSINDITAKNFQWLYYAGVSSIDTSIIKNCKLEKFNYILNQENNVGDAYVEFVDNDFVNFFSTINFTSPPYTKVTFLRNKLNSFGLTKSGTWTAANIDYDWRENEIRNFYSQTELIPATFTHDVTFNDNIIYAIDSTQGQGYIAERGAELETVTFKDQLVFFDEQSNAAAISRINNNKIYAKIDNDNNSGFRVIGGELYFKGNTVTPIDEAMPNYWVTIQDLDTCVITDNFFYFNKNLAPAVFYLANDGSTQGSYVIDGNTGINIADMDKLISGSAANFNNGSDVYFGESNYIGLLADNYGGASTNVYSLGNYRKELTVDAPTIGSALAATDYAITFDGESNDGTITYMEDEDRFDFDNAITAGGVITGDDITSVDDITSGDNIVVGNDLQMSAGSYLNFLDGSGHSLYSSSSLLTLRSSATIGFRIVTTNVAYFSSTALYPVTTRSYNLGTTSNLWQYLYVVNPVIGDGSAGVDYDIDFNGETNDGHIRYMEDEDRFDFSNSIRVGAINLTTESRTFTILKPNEAQAETDDVILMYVDATAYPYGITIDKLTMSTSASCTDTHILEEWATRASGGTQTTLHSLTLSGQETSVAGGSMTDDNVDEGLYININLDDATDDISSLEITITFTINES